MQPTTNSEEPNAKTEEERPLIPASVSHYDARYNTEEGKRDRLDHGEVVLVDKRPVFGDVNEGHNVFPVLRARI